MIPGQDGTASPSRNSGCSIKDVEAWRTQVWNDTSGTEIIVEIIDPSPRVLGPRTRSGNNRVLRRSVGPAKVLAAHSPYFAAMLARDTWRETWEVTVQFSGADVDADTWDHFLYSLQSRERFLESFDPVLGYFCHAFQTTEAELYQLLKGDNLELFMSCLQLKFFIENGVDFPRFYEALLDLYVLADYLLAAPLKNLIIDYFHDPTRNFDLECLVSLHESLMDRTSEGDKLRLLLTMRMVEQYRISHRANDWFWLCFDLPFARQDLGWLARIVPGLRNDLQNWRWSTCPCYFHDHSYGKSEICVFKLKPRLWLGESHSPSIEMAAAYERILYFGGHRHPYQRLKRWQWIPYNKKDDCKRHDGQL